MKTTRRSIFGFLAGAPVAVATAKDKQPVPEFYVGQIRAVHSHYESKVVPHWHTWPAGSGSATYARQTFQTEAVAVLRHEQWNGSEWLPIDPPQERDRT